MKRIFILTLLLGCVPLQSCVAQRPGVLDAADVLNTQMHQGWTITTYGRKNNEGKFAACSAAYSDFSGAKLTVTIGSDYHLNMAAEYSKWDIIPQLRYRVAFFINHHPPTLLWMMAHSERGISYKWDSSEGALFYELKKMKAISFEVDEVRVSMQIKGAASAMDQVKMCVDQRVKSWRVSRL